MAEMQPNPNEFNDSSGRGRRRSFLASFLDQTEIRSEILQDMCPTTESTDSDSSAQSEPKCAKDIPAFGSLQPHRIRFRSTNTSLFSLRACWIKNPMFHYLKLRLQGLAVYRSAGSMTKVTTMIGTMGRIVTSGGLHGHTDMQRS